MEALNSLADTTGATTKSDQPARLKIDGTKDFRYAALAPHPCQAQLCARLRFIGAFSGDDLVARVAVACGVCSRLISPMLSCPPPLFTIIATMIVRITSTRELVTRDG